MDYGDRQEGIKWKDAARLEIGTVAVAEGYGHVRCADLETDRFFGSTISSLPWKRLRRSLLWPADISFFRQRVK